MVKNLVRIRIYRNTLEHIQVINQPYKCDICCKVFSQNHTCSLQKHIRTHTADEPYKCDVCARG